MSHAYRIKSINNDIYISGLTDGAEDYALIKMNPSGELIWSNVYGGNESDHCFAMDVNDENEIFKWSYNIKNCKLGYLYDED